MITVTRLDRRVVVINAELVKMIEAAPDTIITLISASTGISASSRVVRAADDLLQELLLLAR